MKWLDDMPCHRCGASLTTVDVKAMNDHMAAHIEADEAIAAPLRQSEWAAYVGKE